MSPLRSRFVSYLEMRGFTRATVRNYVQAICQYQKWLGKSPLHTTRESARRYLDFLKNGKKLAPRTINIHIYALKRFCDFFLPHSDAMIPFTRMRTPKYQATVISAAEVQAMIDAAPNLKAKAIIATLYSSGIRINECLNLKVSDIDSKRMVLHIFGKGQRERYAILSPTALAILRDYFRRYRPAGDLLFQGYKADAPLSTTAAAHTIRMTARAVGIKSKVTAHVLRHSFATHLLERGESLLVIQRLLGHANVSTTAMYTQVSATMLQNVQSPLDQPPAVAQPLPKPPAPEKALPQPAPRTPSQKSASRATPKTRAKVAAKKTAQPATKATRCPKKGGRR